MKMNRCKSEFNREKLKISLNVGNRLTTLKAGMHYISLSCIVDIHGYLQTHDSEATGFN